MKVIGITGGIGSGKSALLAAVQKEFSCRVLLADDIANFLKEPGQSCYHALVYLLGEGVLDETKHIDKHKMSDMIFGNEALLELVNDIVHPAVKHYICEAIREERTKGLVDFVFVEAALFIEAGYRDIVDSLWYIFARKEVRIHRLQEGRGYSLEKIHSIMNNQLQEEVFRKKCDVIIDNSDSLEKSMAQIRRNLQKHEIM